MVAEGECAEDRAGDDLPAALGQPEADGSETPGGP